MHALDDAISSEKILLDNEGDGFHFGRGRFGENARLTAERYTWDRNAAELRDLFDEVLRNRKIVASLLLIN
jgi:hypothetical protein